MEVILKGKVIALNADGSLSIQIVGAMVMGLYHPWKLGETIFINVELPITDIVPPTEIADFTKKEEAKDK